MPTTFTGVPLLTTHYTQTFAVVFPHPALFPSYGHAQRWSGVLAFNRATDWSTAGERGGIPSATWTQCGSTIAAYNSTGQTIQTAINNCTANYYVLLGRLCWLFSELKSIPSRHRLVSTCGSL